MGINRLWGNNMKKIILDTNALIYFVKFKIDFMEELRRICDFNFEVYVLNKTIDELEKLKKKLALELIKGKNLKILNIAEGKNVDDILIKMSKLGYIVVTQDKELKEKLQKPFITIRQKKYLFMVN